MRAGGAGIPAFYTSTGLGTLLAENKPTASFGDKDYVLEECSLPLTGKNVVDLLVTDLGVFEIDAEKGLRLIELAPESSLELLKEKTGCAFVVADDLKSNLQGPLA